MSIILIVGLLKIIAACVVCYAIYQDVTRLAVGQCLAAMSAFDLPFLYDETLMRQLLEVHLSDFCSAAPRLCLIEAQYFPSTS